MRWHDDMLTRKHTRTITITNITAHKDEKMTEAKGRGAGDTIGGAQWHEVMIYMTNHPVFRLFFCHFDALSIFLFIFSISIIV